MPVKNFILKVSLFTYNIVFKPGDEFYKTKHITETRNYFLTINIANNFV